jgi:DNA modification methylase
MSTTIMVGDVREQLALLENDSIDCCVTSPPYFGLRDYGVEGQLGLEDSPTEYIAALVAVFNAVRRVLKPDGTCWLNIGDSFSSAALRQGAFNLKPKDLCMMPHRLAIALQDAGWWVRQDIVWSKPNPMPESVTDRCTKAHEYIFLLTKSEKYYFNSAAVAEPLASSSVSRLAQNVAAQAGSDRVPGKTNGAMRAVGGAGGTRNKRSVWSMTTQPFRGAHFAVFPLALPDTCIRAGCRPGGVVLDPFLGSGTTALAAAALQHDCVGIELNPAYAAMARKRLEQSSAEVPSGCPPSSPWVAPSCLCWAGSS